MRYRLAVLLLIPSFLLTIVGERKTKLGEYFQGTRLLCIRRNKRDKWWQFWKPRIKSTTFRYMGESDE